MTKGLARQAKTLTDTQFRALLRFVDEETRFPERNRVVVLLSFKSGLRAKEIACLTWGMLTDTEGNAHGRDVPDEQRQQGTLGTSHSAPSRTQVRPREPSTRTNRRRDA